MAGAIGAALTRCFALGWIARLRGTRAVLIPAAGRRGFDEPSAFVLKTDALPGVPSHQEVSSMIVCCIRYTLDPHRIADFEQYAMTWPPIIAACGGKLIGYFLPKEGANNFALALIEFESLAAYERYRANLASDAAAKENVAHAARTGCILVEDRTFLRRT